MTITHEPRSTTGAIEGRRRFLAAALAASAAAGGLARRAPADEGPAQSPARRKGNRRPGDAPRDGAAPGSWLDPNAVTVPVEIAMTRTAEVKPVEGSPAATPASLPKDIADLVQSRTIQIEYVGKGLYRMPDPVRYRLVAPGGETVSVDVEAPPQREFWATYRDERLARTLAVLTGLREDLEFHNGGVSFSHRIVPAQNELLKRAPIASIRPQVPAGSRLVIRGRGMDLATTFRQRWSPLTCELSPDGSQIVHANTEAGATNGVFNQAVVIPFPSGDPVEWLRRRDVQIMQMLLGSGVLLIPAGFALPS